MHSHKTPRRPIECVTLGLYLRSKWVQAGNVFLPVMNSISWSIKQDLKSLHSASSRSRAALTGGDVKWVLSRVGAAGLVVNY